MTSLFNWSIVNLLESAQVALTSLWRKLKRLSSRGSRWLWLSPCRICPTFGLYAELFVAIRLCFEELWFVVVVVLVLRLYY